MKNNYWFVIFCILTSCSAPGSGHFDLDAGEDVEIDQAISDQNSPRDAGFDLGIPNYGGSGCTGECCPISLCQPPGNNGGGGNGGEGNGRPNFQ